MLRYEDYGAYGFVGYILMRRLLFLPFFDV